jgi:hypothetical protein
MCSAIPRDTRLESVAEMTQRNRWDMRWRSFLILQVLCLVCCTGCNSSGIYPVTGKVLVNGEPAVGATVTFIRKGAATPFGEPTPQGTVEEDGTFTLSGPGGEGAAPGEYIVLVEWKEGAGSQRGRAPALTAPDRLKKKYLDPKKPLLAAKVDAKSNELAPFELN